jgi:hypothetical protein
MAAASAIVEATIRAIARPHFSPAVRLSPAGRPSPPGILKSSPERQAPDMRGPGGCLNAEAPPDVPATD